jgi:murein L,D-transpeptidase YafK
MFRLPVVLMILAPFLLHAQQNQGVPAYLLEIPDSVGTILIAETATSTLHQFQAGENGATHQGESYMSVGQNGVDKERAWDRKTPLGIYFITEQLDTSKLHEKYGPMAVSLDYPNIWDRSNRRSGGGIWIHGVTPNSGRRPPLDTDGCIALPNNELLLLEKALEPLVTPVLIAREIRWTSPELLESAHAELRLALDTWVSSYASGDLHRYLSLYDDDFSYRGMNRDEWVTYRTQSITRVPAQRVELDDVLLLVDPEDSALYLARFRQEIVYENRAITTVKRLYWRRSADGVLRIVAEDNG